MVRAQYWEVDDAQVLEKTGHPLAHWRDVLSKAGAGAMKSNDVVALRAALLGADADHVVQQERRLSDYAAPPPAVCSQAAPQALASSRMRRM